MSDVCGWCESRKTTLVGTKDGPESKEGPCSFWIFYHDTCPQLYCPDDWTLSWKMMRVAPIAIYIAMVVCAHACMVGKLEPPSRSSVLEPSRSLEQFKKGLWGGRAQLSAELFQKHWDTQSLRSAGPTYMISVLIAFGASTTLRDVIRRVSIYGAVVSVVLSVVSLSPIFFTRTTFISMGQAFEGLHGIAAALKYITGFVFSFYSLGRVGWWWEIMNQARIIQGRSHDIAMLVGGAVATEDHGDLTSWWSAKWHLYRFQLLVFILSFRPLAPSLKAITYDDLQSAGLLEENEKVSLRKSIHPRKLALKWLSTWVSGYVQDGHLRSLILDKICGLRGACASLHDTVEQRAPYSFEAILYPTIWLWLVLLPVEEINSLTDRKTLLEGGVLLPTLKCMIVAAVYMALIDLLEGFKDPFGQHSDSMSVESILLETETTIVDYLTSPMSDSVLHVCKEQLYREDDEEATRLHRGTLEISSGPL
eukprot:TRINITY_DN80938_c0_g1_i1.p1 TRINITY_DN80938_c0_g1~~TRINITY_DN80938_c0_g1_i1.p1  ORF type:complete len:546 (+),score=35.10 TRINITY_DN80938_c0_g1_i1:206-1639(+)